MKNNTAIRLIACSTIGLIPLSSPAQDQQAEDTGEFSDDAFSMEIEPAKKPTPIYDNFVEFGPGYNANDLSPFTPYSGWNSEGVLINGAFRYLKRGPWDGEDLSFFEAEGEDLGLKTRSLRGEGGVQGKYKLFLQYDHIPYNYFETKTPYQDIGSDSPSLPPNWESNPPQDFNTATQSLPELSSSQHKVDIKTERSRYGGGVEWNIDRNWTAKLKGQKEKKEGTKPLGIAWGTSGQNAAAVIVPAPVDHETDTWDTEIGYQTRKMQFSAAYQYSRFNNQSDTLTVDNPFTYSGWNPAASYPDGIAEAQLAPDNTAHSFNFAGGYNFSDATRLTGNLVYSRYKQNEDFLPYTSNALLTVDQGLPRDSLDGEIANTIGNIELYTRPAKAVEVKARYRYTDRDNDTPRDQYIYVRGDAENQQIGGTEPNYRTNTPYSYREHLAGADIGYRFRTGTKLTLGYDYKKIDRTYEARESNTENTGRIDLRHRFTDTLSGSAQYARTWRKGADYDSTAYMYDSYSPEYIDSLGEDPFINHPLTRDYYLASMIEDKASVRGTYMPVMALTFGARGTYLHQDYDNTEVGLTDVKGWGAQLDATYAVSTDLSLTGFYAYDRRKSDQAGWSFGAGPDRVEEASDPALSWSVDNLDRANTLGAALNWRISKAFKLTADYSYTNAKADTSTASGGAVEAEDFPDATSKIHRLRSDLDYEMSDQTTLGLSYVYERYNSSDWQTDDLTADTIGRVLSLETLDSDYDNHLVLVWARLKF